MLQETYDAVLQSMSIPFPLRQYQWEGVRFLTSAQSALLADEMGLGKTVQVSVSLAILKKLKSVRRILIVVPASLRDNWESELMLWAPSLVVRRLIGNSEDRLAYHQLPIDVLLSSYEQVRDDFWGRTPAGIHYDLVVLDEAQRIKNKDSVTSIAVKSVPKDRGWALTGTPIENRVEDLVSLFQFLGRPSLSQGLARPEMHTLIKPHFLRRRKAEVAKELPPIIEQTLLISLTGAQRSAYNRLRQSRRLMDDSTANLLGLITKLKQLCNFDESSGQSAKLEALLDILDEVCQSRQKVIIFSQFVRTIEWLASKLPLTPHCFHGEMTQSQKSRSLALFKSEPGPSILLISLLAGGVGLNIQEADVVVLFDRWWNPAVEAQAVQRAHRFGRKRTLVAIKFLCADTIEERIQSILHEKIDIFDEYVNLAPIIEPPRFTHEVLRKILE